MKNRRWRRGVSFLLAAAMTLSVAAMLFGSPAWAKDVDGYVGSSNDNGDGTFTNAVVDSDVPDPDIIRVDDAFYMVSTSMHFSPGIAIMRSYDLVNWETVNYVYNIIDNEDNLSMRDGRYEYGSGSWASSLCYNKHDGLFYVTHASNTTGKTYIYTTDDIENGT